MQTRKSYKSILIQTKAWHWMRQSRKSCKLRHLNIRCKLIQRRCKFSKSADLHRSIERCTLSLQEIDPNCSSQSHIHLQVRRSIVVYVSSSPTITLWFVWEPTFSISYRLLGRHCSIENQSLAAICTLNRLEHIRRRHNQIEDGTLHIFRLVETSTLRKPTLASLQVSLLYLN